jgi:Mn-dependent DtxR family transcriptional regulator
MPPRAVEEYLRTIQALDDDGVAVIQARIAERLGHKAPSVSQMVERLTADGYVWRSGRLIYLTDWGREVAAEVIRKHRLANRLLVDVLGVPDICKSGSHIISVRTNICYVPWACGCIAAFE